MHIPCQFFRVKRVKKEGLILACNDCLQRVFTIYGRRGRGVSTIRGQSRFAPREQLGLHRRFLKMPYFKQEESDEIVVEEVQGCVPCSPPCLCRQLRRRDFGRKAQGRRYKNWHTPQLMKLVTSKNAAGLGLLIFFNNFVMANATMAVRALTLVPPGLLSLRAVHARRFHRADGRLVPTPSAPIQGQIFRE